MFWFSKLMNSSHGIYVIFVSSIFHRIHNQSINGQILPLFTSITEKRSMNQPISNVLCQIKVKLLPRYLKKGPGRKIIDNGQVRLLLVGISFRETVVGISFQHSGMGIVFQNIVIGIWFRLTCLGIVVPKATAGNPIPTTIFGNEMYLHSPRVHLMVPMRDFVCIPYIMLRLKSNHFRLKKNGIFDLLLFQVVKVLHWK